MQAAKTCSSAHLPLNFTSRMWSPSGLMYGLAVALGSCSHSNQTWGGRHFTSCLQVTQLKVAVYDFLDTAECLFVMQVHLEDAARPHEEHVQSMIIGVSRQELQTHWPTVPAALL